LGFSIFSRKLKLRFIFTDYLKMMKNGKIF